MKTAPPKGKPWKKGEPLQLACGGIVLPEEDKDGNKYYSAEYLKAEADVEEALKDPFSDVHAETYHRTLADLPQSEAAQIKTTFLILSMSIWGLNEYAIARFLDFDVETVQYVIESEMFTTLRTEILEALRYSEESAIHGFLANEAKTAAVTIAKMLKGPDKDRAFNAAKDILDRSGFRPVDRVEHSHSLGDDLRIVTIQEKPIKEIEL